MFTWPGKNGSAHWSEYKLLYGKNFGGKKCGKKAPAKDWRKKLWQMLTCITNHQLTVE